MTAVVVGLAVLTVLLLAAGGAQIVRAARRRDLTLAAQGLGILFAAAVVSSLNVLAAT